MLVRLIAVACVVLFTGISAAIAQSTDPSELPPADYQGQSYVDSKGCIYLKAGYGGNATWVPRVGQDRKPICGQTPTSEAAQVSDASGQKGVVRQLTRIKKQKVPAAPRAPVLIGCPVSVPIARRYATTDGGSVVICTATNGSLTGARSPIYPTGTGVGAALSTTRYAGATIPLGQGKLQVSQSSAASAPPAGYTAAWQDDRFNPLRGKGTAEGEAAQDRIWTRDVPAEEIATVAKPARASKAVASSGGGTFYVQVGTFGEPTNAEGVRARLKGLGLPVSNGKFRKQGKVLQVVYAGPFASGAEAQAALSAARGNGFADAFIR